jgi:hypothetical protein
VDVNAGASLHRTHSGGEDIAVVHARHQMYLEVR